MTYPQTLKYLESFVDYERIPSWPYKESLKLKRIVGFLNTINNPQATLKCIHAAGTKGKGSTCAFIAYILREAGYSVGFYTSPHLSDFRERIRILKPIADSQTSRARKEKQGGKFEGMISKERLKNLVLRLKPLIKKYNEDSKSEPLSFFEVYTALAFVYFKEEKVDFAVLETGLGGKLDATNTANSLVAVITPISYEHTQKLGNTLTEIAKEKAGIIKSGCQSIVIMAPQEKEAAKVIRNRCQETGARLYAVGKDIEYHKTKSGFKIKGVFGCYSGLKINLLGKHQLINAATAVGAVEALRFYDAKVAISSCVIKDGLYHTVWPGRCEVLSEKPLVVLDGAQNVASVKVLKEAVRNNFRYRKLILVLGVSVDKDVKGICNELNGFADKIILTKSKNPRATLPNVLAGYFSAGETHITYNVEKARGQAKKLADKADLILVCGSLFVVGEFRSKYNF